MQKKTNKNLLLYLFLLLFIFSFPFILNSQSLKSQITKFSTNQFSETDLNELITKCDNFFKLLINKKVNEAFNNILINSTIGKKQEQVNNLIEQTKRVNEIYGEANTFEKINYENVGTSLIKIRYLTLHKEYPMKWTFTFYKSPEKGWIIINLKFDDVIEDLFEKD